MLGAFVALKVAGLSTTLPVLIGLLMLLGLAAENSILIVEFAIEDERAGQERREAILAACRERARPWPWLPACCLLRWGFAKVRSFGSRWRLP